MRACIVGGGLAGSLLAWRLAREASGWDVHLVVGPATHADATAASGGAVRGYERHPEQRRLATASMAELLASPTLREWAGYQEAGSLYLRDTAAGLDAEIADVDAALPGSVRLIGAAELATLGWAGVPDAAVGVAERSAGYTSPERLRRAVLADGAVQRRVTVTEASVGAIEPARDGTIACTVGGSPATYDVVVVAAGPWTPALLRGSGLPAAGYRTKSIQYSVYRTGDWRPPPFVDEVSGLYGRPAADAGLLLGLPSEQWEVDPDRPPVAPELHDEAVRRAGDRFPMLRIGPLVRRVGAVDCYAGEPVLALRPVGGADHRLLTFSGGAGGSVKTALAASHRAATQLVESGQPAELTSVGLGEGQR
ncbi:MAG: NAD(P)/FAD-dependent oxidoreductase [Frankiaceae bacterium]